MVGTLEFKTPFLIHSAVREVLESSNDDSVNQKYERDRNDNFRPWLWYRTLWESICVPKHTLIGVDLSSSMANRAKARNVYKNVIVADVLDFLQSLSCRCQK